VGTQVVRPRMKGFIALDAHPVGCARQVAATVDAVQSEESRHLVRPGPVVVLGGSGGYGLPAAAVAAFRYGVPVVLVCLERPAQRGRTASAGWYNVVELARQAHERGTEIVTVNADCFADATKDRVVEELKRLGPPSLLVYSVASPVRTDPATGITHRSVLKPIGTPFTTKTVKIDTGELAESTLEPATDDELQATIDVMGGDDWALWLESLTAAGLIQDGLRTVAFDYMGPAATHPIYRSGTIGQAKAHLERTARQLDATLAQGGGGAWASVNAAAVTQSSAAIPAVPLYLSLLLRVAGGSGTFEAPVAQMCRLFDDYLAPPAPPVLDSDHRIRLDGWELADDVQAEIARRWEVVTNETFRELADFDAFQLHFRQLFGFDVPGVDYDEAVDPDLPWPA
jgi:enoyl-[acyl-carrier protein] reductase / trans-2-enoyl-CoA reductase (NAD+)